MVPNNAGKRYVVSRDNNVVRIEFRRDPDPPAPKFPGAGALRRTVWFPQLLNAVSPAVRRMEAA